MVCSIVDKNTVAILNFAKTHIYFFFFYLQLDMTHVPDNFLRADLQVDGQRHLVFMTDLQMKYMVNAKTWYIDGTFKVARAPFVQMCSIHVFIRSGKCEKQVAVCYILMSRRKKSDYVAVFNAVLSALPPQPAVTEAVLDFEKAAWAALRECRPHLRIHGCWFHWAQAVYRKVCIISHKFRWGFQGL